MKNLLLITLSSILILLSGCASAGNAVLKKETEDTIATKIEEGVTTMAQVRETFGSPFDTTYTDGGLEVWTYELQKMRADAVNYIPVVGLFGSSASGTKKQLKILFDENEVVKKFSMSESPVKVKTGLFN